MLILFVLLLAVHSCVYPSGSKVLAGNRALENPPPTAVDTLLSFAMDPDTLRAHFSDSQFAALVVRHSNYEHLKEYDRIDLNSDVRIDSYIDTVLMVDGHKVTAVACQLRLGVIGYCVAIGTKRPTGCELAFCTNLLDFPPPFWSGVLTAFEDLTGDGIPDAVVEYYGGQCFQFDLFRWDGGSTLLPMGKLNPSVPGGIDYVIAGRFGVGHVDRDGDGIPELSEGDKIIFEKFNSVSRIYKWNGNAYELWKQIYRHTPGPSDTLVVYPQR